jgi:hypothetical protein
MDVQIYTETKWILRHQPTHIAAMELLSRCDTPYRIETVLLKPGPINNHHLLQLCLANSSSRENKPVKTRNKLSQRRNPRGLSDVKIS